MKYLGSVTNAADISNKSYVDSWGLNVVVTTATTVTAVINTWYRGDTTSNSIAFTLPSAPTANIQLVLENSAGSNSVTYVRGGTDTIEGSTSTYTLNPGEWVELSYNVSNAQWYQRRYLTVNTAGTNMRRDTAGRAQVVSPSAANDIANKTYVDTADANKMSIAPLTFTSGDYWIPNGQTGASTSQLTQAREIAIPFFIGISVSISRIVAEVTTAGSAGSVIRLGIRNMDSAGLPANTAPVLDAGTISGTAVAIAEITLGSALLLNPGWYYYTYTQQGAPTTLSTVRIANTYNLFLPTPIRVNASATTLMQGSPAGYYQSSITGALPSTWTTAGITGIVPKIAFRAT